MRDGIPYILLVEFLSPLRHGGVSNEGCASFVWVSHRVDLNLENFVIIASWLCYITARLTLLELYPAPSIIIILNNNSIIITLPFLNEFARIGKQNLIQYPRETIVGQ